MCQKRGKLSETSLRGFIQQTNYHTAVVENNAGPARTVSLTLCGVSSLQVHVGTSHQEQRVVGYLTCTHLHAIEGTVAAAQLLCGTSVCM